MAGLHHSNKYSFRAIQDERHPKFLKTFHGGLPLLKNKDHFRAISQQCTVDTMDLYDSPEYSTALEQYAAELSASEYDCVSNINGALECSFDYKSLNAHNTLVRVCQEANGISYLFTYSSTCDVLFDDGFSRQAIFMDINVPECFASSCTIDELEEAATEIAKENADDTEQGLLSSIASIASAVCAESAPVGTPTMPSNGTTPDTTMLPTNTTMMPPTTSTQASSQVDSTTSDPTTLSSSRTTAKPSVTSTQASSQVDPSNFLNLTQTMTGVSPLSNESWQIYEEEYKNFYIAFYDANPQFGISGVNVLLEFVSQDPPLTRRLGERQLQETLTLVYNQVITYLIIPFGSGITAADVITQPFAAYTSRVAFANLLRDSGDNAFTNIESVSGVTQIGSDTTPDPTTNPNPTAPAGTTPGSTTTRDPEQQCASDTNALFENQQFASAYEAWWTEFDAATNVTCQGLCIYDSKEYSSHDAFLSACEQAGGDAFLFSDSLYCSGSDTDTVYKLEVHLVDHPKCIAKTCNSTEYVEILDSFLDEVGEEREQESNISNYQCFSPDATTSGLSPGRSDETSLAYIVSKVLAIGVVGVITIVIMI